MDGIKIDVTGNIAKVTEKPRRITSGTIGLPVEFTFDDQWDGLKKVAVFCAGAQQRSDEINGLNAIVPWEILANAGYMLRIGVFGANDDGTTAIPTIWTNVSVIQIGAVPDGASPGKPTPPVWQRIENEVNRIGGIVDDVNDKYDEAQEQIHQLNEETNKKVANAVTESKSYTDKSVNETIDKLCPSFSESGSIVTCEPLEGYPLNITAEEGATKITRCGKNLLSEGWRVWDNYDKNNNFILSLPPGKYTASAKHAEPKLESYLFLKYSKDGGVSWNNIDTNLVANLKTNVAKFDVTAEEIWALSTAKAIYLPRIESVQIELGTEATDHEPFRGGTFSVGEPVPAIAGVNYIYADAGSVTVAGKSDLVSIIDKLTKTVEALLGG